MANANSMPLAGSSTNRVRRWLAFVLLGSFLGLIVAVLALFVLAFLYGEAMGLSLASCVGVACSITLLWSHHAGLTGIVVGGVVGAIAGGVVHYVHHRPRTT